MSEPYIGNRSEMWNILKDVNLYNSLTSDKKDILKAGCDLVELTKNDILYIANPKTTLSQADRRLIGCRKKRY